MTIKSVYILLTGRVHGVGFRYFAYYKAEKYNITGWVRNISDGKVEIEATGIPEDISKFIECIKTGPARAIIESCSVAEFTPNRAFTNFTIR